MSGKVWLGKTFVLVIIVLFIGSDFIPSTIGTIGKKTNFKEIKSPGYIQDLIDNASDGDTIYIPSGIYYENIIINKSISLVGEDKNTTVIDGEENGIVVYVSADEVNISGFTIQNSGSDWNDAGIELHSNYSIIIKNIISNNFRGIYILDSSNNLFTSNTISDNKYEGMILYSSNRYNTIKDNIISNNGCGINLEYPSGYNTITGNTISNSGGKVIILEGSFRNNISDNIISNSGDDCIYLNGAISNTISNNTISDSGYDGIGLLFSSKNNIIQGNNINSNDECGIHLWHSCNRNNITENIITSNNEDGIEILASDYNTISDNEISNNGYGINLHCNFMGDDFSNDNYIGGNTINSNKKDGIYLHNRETSSDNNIITKNAFSSNNKKSINFSCSGDNIISKNNFLGFKRHVFFEECENTWEHNYWCRPRILPKLIFGKNTIGYKILPWINIDWLPALRPYKMGE